MTAAVSDFVHEILFYLAILATVVIAWAALWGLVIWIAPPVRP